MTRKVVTWLAVLLLFSISLTSVYAESSIAPQLLVLPTEFSIGGRVGFHGYGFTHYGLVTIVCGGLNVSLKADYLGYFDLILLSWGSVGTFQVFAVDQATNAQSNIIFINVF
jgi:hypothetical protein